MAQNWAANSMAAPLCEPKHRFVARSVTSCRLKRGGFPRFPMAFFWYGLCANRET